MDFTNQSVSSFFRGFILKSLEGWLFIFGSVLCVTWGFMLWFTPDVLPVVNQFKQGVIGGFLLMPLVLFVTLIKFAQSDYRPSFLTNIMLLMMIGLPFYAAYFS
ncbi:MAG TPA: hypothetical protein PKZ37_16795 [Gallionellaceae bacterium]|jgi:hypothetical protein|nr:hypothetical protein [Gallionellaceae bacterium]